jgi:nucleotide-binding universal stress UspA family protein
MYKKILVPLDGSKNDEVVLEHVKRLASDLGAALTLILLYRMAPADDPFEKQIQMEEGSSGYRAKERAKVYLPQLEEAFARESLRIKTDFLVVEEPEADAIVKYAQKNNFDLIVLANRVHSAIGSFFFGNIEEKVRRRSSLPVLFVSAARDKESSR